MANDRLLLRGADFEAGEFLVADWKTVGDYLLLRTGDRLILRVGAAAADVLPVTLQAIEQGVVASRGMQEIEEGFIA